MIKALMFDFDGVILDSSKIKTNAYKQLFDKQNIENHKAIMEYHIKNMGYSREKIIRYYFSDILDVPVSDERIKGMVETFKKSVLEKIFKAPYILGVPKFLELMKIKYPLFIITGTPQEEIHIIVEALGIKHYFQGIYGSPKEKETSINEICSSMRIETWETVYFGDAESDRVAAQNTGARFIGVRGSGSGVMGRTDHMIKDFTELHKIQQIILNED
jgi:HAD superfamily hydrolase (TIGR01549 family)